MLEELGIWALTYRGTLLYIGRHEKLLGQLHYVDDMLENRTDSLACGHSWVYTPSLPIVDLTAKHQPTLEGIAKHIPSPVLSAVEDSPKVERHLYYLEGTGSTEYELRVDQFFRERSWWPEWNRLHKPVEVPGRVALRYVPMDIAFSAERINESPTYLQDIKVDGLHPAEFVDKIKGSL